MKMMLINQLAFWPSTMWDWLSRLAECPSTRQMISNNEIEIWECELLHLCECMRNVNLIIEMNTIINYNIEIWNLCDVYSIAHWVCLSFSSIKLMLRVLEGSNVIYMFDYK